MLKRSLLVIIITAGILLLSLRTHALSSSLASDIAWVRLNKLLQETSPASEESERVADQFQKAISSNHENRSAWFGQGLTYTLRGDVDLAHASWSGGQAAPDTLIEYGIIARREGYLDTALIFFRGADALGNELDSAAKYLAGSICQRTFGSPGWLGEKNSGFCARTLAENENNLILNGDFAIHDYYGWEGDHYFADEKGAQFDIEDSSSEPGAPSIKLVGHGDDNHFGLFQKLALAAGSTVRFSGRFKVDNQDNLEARLLYIEWQGEDGIPQGNHGAQQDLNLRWTNFERTFTVPEDSEPLIDFYPLVFSGQGAVWFDDIRLELIND